MDAARCDTINTVICPSICAMAFRSCRVRREIKRGCAVVHNENLRLLHERTRNRRALSLSARKVSAALLDLTRKVRLPWHPQTPCLCSLKRLIHLLVRGVELPQLKFSRMVPLKENRLLQNNTDLRHEFIQCIIPHILPVDENLSSGRIVKPWNQIHDRRFSRTGSSDNTDGLSV